MPARMVERDEANHLTSFAGAALLILNTLAMRQAVAQTAFNWGVEVVVTQEIAAQGHVYRYRVVNAGPARSGQFFLGFDPSHDDAFLVTEPTIVLSPEGWTATIEGGEGKDGIAISWETTTRRDATRSIPGAGELSGFEVVLPRPDPYYKTTRATVTFWDSNEDTVTVTSSTPLSDMTEPTVAITSPLPDGNGPNVYGTVLVIAKASDNVGILDVRFQVDGGDIVEAPYVGEEPPLYSVAWNSRRTSNGVHSLTAIARDAAGNTTVSAPHTVTVANDVTPPAVQLVSNTTTVPNGSHTIRATVIDRVGRVGFVEVGVRVDN